MRPRQSGAIKRRRRPVPPRQKPVRDARRERPPLKTRLVAQPSSKGVAHAQFVAVVVGLAGVPLYTERNCNGSVLRDGPGAYGPQCSADPPHVTADMDDIIDVEANSERPSLAECRELLGDEASELSDEQLDAIRQHAQAMAHVLVEIFLTTGSRS